MDRTRRLEALVALLSESSPFEIGGTVQQVRTNPESDETRLLVSFTGRDTPLLTANNGRVLDAIETLALDVLELDGMERPTLEVDAGSFLADQEIKMGKLARAAISEVRSTGKPRIFPPMCDRDLRMLEKELVLSGLPFETLGTPSRRWMVLFPADAVEMHQGLSSEEGLNL